MMQIPCLPRLRYLLSCWGHRELQELPVSINRDSGNVLLSFPLTWHLTVYCFVLGCCLPVSLSSCLSQMTSLFRWCRRIPSAFLSAFSAQGRDGGKCSLHRCLANTLVLRGVRQLGPGVGLMASGGLRGLAGFFWPPSPQSVALDTT